MNLRLVGHQLGKGAPEPDRLGRQLASAAVALVEDQVDDGEHGVETVREHMPRRHLERDPRRFDLALGPGEPLRHRLLRNEERAGDLLCGQTAERAQRECDLAIERERRMAARKEQLEPLVPNRRVLRLLLHGLRHLEQARLLSEDAVAADAVDRAVSCGRHEPGSRMRGRPLARPARGGDRERLLRGFLGEVEVAEEADQAGEDTPPFLAKDPFEDPYPSRTGRTSTAPPILAAGIREATSIAASRSSPSNTSQPPSASLTATNGPSVVSVLPASTRTVVAVSGGWSQTSLGVTPGVWLTAW